MKFEESFVYKFFRKVEELRELTGDFLKSLDDETKSAFGLHKIEQPKYDEKYVDRFEQLYRKIVFFHEKYAKLANSKPTIMNFSSLYYKTEKEGEEVEAMLAEIKQVMEEAKQSSQVDEKEDENEQ